MPNLSPGLSDWRGNHERTCCLTTKEGANVTTTTDETRTQFVAHLAKLTARLPHIPQAVQAEWMLGCAIAAFEEAHSEAATLEWLRCVADEFQSRLQAKLPS